MGFQRCQDGDDQAVRPAGLVHDPQEPPPHAGPNDVAAEMTWTEDLRISECSLRLAPGGAAQEHPVSGMRGVGDAGHDAAASCAGASSTYASAGRASRSILHCTSRAGVSMCRTFCR